MAESAEQMMIRMGYDAQAVALGTAKMLADQESAAAKVSAIWKKQAADQKMMSIREAESLEARLLEIEVEGAARRNRARALLRQRAEVQDARRAVVNAEIAGGSGAFSWIGGINTAKKIEGAGEEAAKELHGFSGIMRETAVIFREGLRGNFTRMIGSVSLLVGYIGAAAAAVTIPLAAIVGLPAYRTYKAFQGEKESAKSLEESQRGAGENYSAIISDLVRAGRLTDKDKTQLERQIKNGDIMGVMNRINPLLANGTAEEQAKAVEQAREVSRIHQETMRNENEAQRETMGHFQRIQNLEYDRYKIWDKMTGLKKDSVEYAQAEQEASRLTVQIEREKRDLMQERKDLQKQYTDEQKQARKIQGAISQMGVADAVPTIEDLAGENFTRRLGKLYGKGGAYDLAAGDGPFAADAQQAMLAKKQEQWDIIHGNAVWQYNPATGQNELVGGQAKQDQVRRIAYENRLSAAGLDTPEMRQQQMNRELAQVNANMAELLTAAKKDGIVLKDSTP
jgi:hypothetical protein